MTASSCGQAAPPRASCPLPRHLRAVKSCENYTELLLLSGERLLVRRTLKSVGKASSPSPPSAVSTGRPFMNLARVTKIERAGEEETALRASTHHIPPSPPAAARSQK